MVYPKSLTKNSIIGITAPSAGILDKEESFNRSVEQLEKVEFKIIVTDNVRTTGLVSGSAESRGQELGQLYQDEAVQLILCATGGDFLNEMLPYVDYSLISKHPKWIQGYSDPTGLLFSITTKCDQATIYGPNGGSYDMSEWHQSLLDNLEILRGNLVIQNSSKRFQSGWGEGIDGYDLDQETYWETPNGAVDVTGRLIGGCADVLLDLLGTPYEDTANYVKRYQSDGWIWYFDIFALSAEVFARGLWRMKEAGWFTEIKAIVLGRVRFPSTELELTYENAVSRIMPGVPLVTGVDIGHVKPSMTLINGAIGRIIADAGQGELQMWFKEK